MDTTKETTEERKQEKESLIDTDDEALEWEGIVRAYLSKEQYKQLQGKVFQKDLLEGTLIGNLHKIFVMPIYQELSNIHILA